MKKASNKATFKGAVTLAHDVHGFPIPSYRYKNKIYELGKCPHIREVWRACYIVTYYINQGIIYVFS